MATTKEKPPPGDSSDDDLLICTPAQCTKDQDNDVLKCERCGRHVHYRCTLLPAYQVQLFKMNTRQHKFVCINCVAIDKKVLELVPNKPRPQPPLRLEKEIEDLKRELEACKGLLKKYEEDKFRADSKTKELETLKKKLHKEPALHTLEYVEQKFENKLETRLEAFKESIIGTIKSEFINVSEKSYAAATRTVESEVTQPKTIKEAIKEAWREDEAEENDKARRAKNFIVHGVSEQDHNDDKKWIDNLITDTHSRVSVKQVVRLGKHIDDKKRPMLVCLANESEKSKLLSNLPALSGIEKYANVSVTEDLTPTERKQLKDLSNEAKIRNANENSSTEKWRVRGNSKNGYFLKKIKIKKLENKTINQEKKTVTFSQNTRKAKTNQE